MNEFHQEPKSGWPNEIWALAKQYHEETEAYDRTICTGPITEDGITPMNSNEHLESALFADDLWHRLWQQAKDMGYGGTAFRECCAKYLQHNRP
jgi:hypothetical protein